MRRSRYRSLTAILVCRGRNCFDITLISGATLVFLLSIAGWFGRLGRYIDLFSGNRMQYLLLGLIMLVPAVLFATSKHGVFRLWPLLMTFLTVIVNAAAVVPWYLSDHTIVPHVSEPKLSLKLCYLNVLGTNRQYDKVLQFIHEEQPDFALFSEATTTWGSALSVLAADYPHHLRVDRTDFELFGKHRIQQPNLRLFGEIRGYVNFMSEIRNTQITSSLHHAYPRFHYGERGFTWRNDQLVTGIGHEIAAIDQPLIVIGDLNTDMWSAYFREMMRLAPLRNARKGHGVLLSQGVNHGLIQSVLLRTPIDHCLVSNHFHIEEIRLGPNLGSDHLPLVVRASLY